jgi:phosphoenolpyruvate synthase/pyruvate phosphate dikinase
MPLLMHESELPQVIARARQMQDAGPVDDGTEMRGTPVSRGSVEAEVVVIADPGDFGSMKRGAILVTRATDPSWTPLFTLASGVIVEVGGVLSHASTIAREYGLPALANVKQATRRLKTGDRVLLNATEGWVRRC